MEKPTVFPMAPLYEQFLTVATAISAILPLHKKITPRVMAFFFCKDMKLVRVLAFEANVSKDRLVLLT